MKNLAFSIAIIFLLTNFANAQTFWAEYQNNYQHYLSDSTFKYVNILTGFYSGKSNAAGYSINAFALAQKGWGEVLVLPTLTKETKAGLFSFSLGAGIETATEMPRIGASIFYLKGRFEGLFFWEQGTNQLSNNWHLCYLTYTAVRHEEGPYCSFGLHSQRGAIHGFRAEIGDKDNFSVWLVLGKPTLRQRSVGTLIGLRKFF